MILCFSCQNFKFAAPCYFQTMGYRPALSQNVQCEKKYEHDWGAASRQSTVPGYRFPFCQGALKNLFDLYLNGMSFAALYL